MSGTSNRPVHPTGSAAGTAEPELGILDFGIASAAATPRTVQERIDMDTFKLRRTVAIATLVTFVIINGLVMFGLYRALLFDMEMVSKPVAGYERFITEAIIQSLLAATTIQLGAIMFAVTKFLFPSRRAQN